MKPEVRNLINQTDWNAIEHAFGPASDLPSLFARLVSSDRCEHRNALDQLENTVWHQGTVYAASAPAARILAALAAEPATQSRAGIILLLAHIAQGSGYMQVHQSLLLTPPTDLDSTLAREANEVAAAREAVRESLPLLLGLLHDTDFEVRAAVPRLAWAFIEERARLGEPLRQTAGTDRVAYVRACATLGLAGYSASDEATLAFVESRLSRDMPEGIAAAVGSVMATQSVSPDAARWLRLARRRGTSEREFLESTWGGLDHVLDWLDEVWDGMPGIGVGE